MKTYPRGYILSLLKHKEGRYMPLFTFKCSNCGKEFTSLIRTMDNEETKCPECGSEKVKRVFSPFAFLKASCNSRGSSGSYG